MDPYAQMAVSIIEAQEALIGPVAIMQASAIQGIQVDWEHKQVQIPSDGMQTIDKLVQAYSSLFGQVSVQVCKEATGRLVNQLKPDQLPVSLR